MAIVNIDNEYNTKEELVEKKVPVTTEKMKTSTLYQKEKPIENIIQYPKGMKWEVSYFLQIRDMNDTISPPDVNVSSTVQKYYRINKLIVNLQSPISQDTISSISGDAIINAGFMPNVHDVFLATLTGGREGIFILTEVVNKTYNLKEIYDVSFKLFALVDSHPNVYNDLIKKVMKEYVYDKDHLLDYSAPVILRDDYKKKISLRDAVPDLIDYYMTSMINDEKRLICLPTKQSIYVDTMLDDFIFKIINYDSHEVCSKLNRLSITKRNDIQYTIWDVLVRREKNLLKKCSTDIGFKYMPYGWTPLITREMHRLGVSFLADKLNGSRVIMETINKSIKKADDFVPPVQTQNKQYVFSKSFYEGNKEDMGLIEKLVWDYLDYKIINNDDLQIALNQYMMWDTIDQYYLIPILIMLVKDSINNTFKQL